MNRIAIVTDDPGWHGQRLREAFAARGCDSVYLSLRDCRLELDGGEARVCVPGFGDSLPGGVFVRGVPGGSLEEVVYWLNVLHALDACGVPVYNHGRAIERSVDKALTSFLLAAAGIPTPPTWICTDKNAAQARLHEEIAAGHRLVSKPLFGSQGRDLRLLESADAVPEAAAVNGVWYLQRHVRTGARQAADWRVFVIGGRAVAAMRRTAEGWVTNVARGGRCHAALPEGALRELAERAGQCLGMAYAGVDLIRDEHGGWWVLEVNSAPAWKGLQAVTRVDIAALLAEDLLRRMLTEAPRERAV